MRLKEALLPRAWGFLLDIIYPPRCAGCNRRGMLLCADCAAATVPVPAGWAEVERIEALICGGVFGGPLRQAIHRLKYESDSPLARPLAAMMAEALALDERWVADDDAPPVVVPVPLHPSKKRLRGYNQAELLARELCRITCWQLREELVRVKAMRSQVGLDAEGRAENVRDAFQWAGEAAPLSVLLVDDVCTTGAALSECAFALMAKGTEHVFAATVVRAIGDSPNVDS